MFTLPSSLFSPIRSRQRKNVQRQSVKLNIECLEQRLVFDTAPGGVSPSAMLSSFGSNSTAAPAPAVVHFSPDEKTVTIQADGHSWTIARPVVSPENYQTTGNVYWVSTTGSDTNDGSFNHPFATINQGVNRANPGDIVYVESGTYVDNLYITKSGQPDAPIIISAAPGDLGQVTITPSDEYVQSNPDGAVITLDGANYVWINGLVIEGPKGRPSAPTTEDYGANGITWEGGAGLGDRATNNVIYNNVHCGLKAIEQGPVDAGILIEGNIIFDNGADGLSHGIYMPADDVTMNGNVIFDNWGYGIHSYTAPSGQVITNNVIFGNGAAGIILGGGNNQVYNNTVAYNGFGGIYYYKEDCVNNIVEHNIFAFNVLGDGIYDDSGVNTDDDNDYAGGVDSRINPGPNDISVDPQFVNAAGGDFRLQSGSPAAGLGAFAAVQTGGAAFDLTVGSKLTNAIVASFNNDVQAVASATINWGDGTTSAGHIVLKSTGGFQVLGSHVYNMPSGSSAYTITITVTDGPIVQTARASAVVHPASGGGKRQPPPPPPGGGQGEQGPPSSGKGSLPILSQRLELGSGDLWNYL